MNEKLYIVCGHGDGDSGACGNGYTESERVRTLAKRIKQFGGANVVICSPDRNWYRDNLFSTNEIIPKGGRVLELHLDSSTSKSARGGHVIIKAGLKADKYDKALAKFISGMFAGRSVTISERSDLANPKRAHARGYNYRLMECCFISNKENLSKFNRELDTIAKGILKCFDVPIVSEPSEKVTNKVYRVQVGAFTKKENAETMLRKLEKAGFDGRIV